MYSYTLSGDQKKPTDRSAGCAAVLNGSTPIVAPTSSCGTVSYGTAPVNLKRPGQAAASRSAAARCGPSPISRNWQSRPCASSSPAARTKSSTPCQARNEPRKTTVGGWESRVGGWGAISQPPTPNSQLLLLGAKRSTFAPQGSSTILARAISAGTVV